VTTYIAVCGPAEASPEEAALAEAVGREIARAGAILICGGLGGAMDAAARGCANEGGTSIGILPGETRAGASPHLTLAVPTGLGEARNVLVVRAADAVIAVSGEYGTLSEIALALKTARPVVGLGTWRLAHDSRPDHPDPILRSTDPVDAVRVALAAL